MPKLVVIVLAFNEVDSLIETIQILEDSTEARSTQIVISTSKFADPKCRKTAYFLEERYANVIVYEQKEPFVAAAVLEATDLFDSEYVIYMSADKETPALLVPTLLQKIEENAVDIVSASRWVKGGSFTGYGKLKWLISKIAQWLCKLIYVSSLTEYTYGFRIYKREIFERCHFRETKHPFFLESLLIPLRLGYKIQEVPVAWLPRTEGKSIVTFSTLVSYLRPIIYVRVMSRKKLEYRVRA
jgi:dolichol-phosphate mannosyltransferase